MRISASSLRLLADLIRSTRAIRLMEQRRVQRAVLCSVRGTCCGRRLRQSGLVVTRATARARYGATRHILRLVGE